MSLFNVFNISASSMSAQSVRLNTIASNLANGESVSGSEKTTYKARTPIFKAVLNEETQTYGVEVTDVVESKAPLRKEYDPYNPQANNEGFVYRSNVNVIDQMTDMISASRSYQGSGEVAESAKTMLLKTLALGDS